MADAKINLKANWYEILAEHAADCPRPHPANNVSEEEFARFERTLGQISYRDWIVQLTRYQGFALMQVAATVPDSFTDEPIQSNGRSLPLCPDMSDGCLYDLAFELVKEFETHELAERFSVASERPYFPHDAAGAPLFEVPALRGAGRPHPTSFPTISARSAQSAPVE